MMRLKKSMALGPRKEVPTAMEIQAAKERQPVIIRVHLLDGSYKTVPAEAWTTLRDLNAMMAKKLKITQTHSVIDRLENQKRTIRALGLGRPNNSVEQPDTPQIRGMIRTVSHLVRVEEIQSAK